MAIIQIQESEFFYDWRNKFNQIGVLLGDLSSLTTTNKTSLINAINELDSDIGDLSTLDSNIGNLANLNTTDKTSLVNAINELVNSINGLDSEIGDLLTLTTTLKTSLIDAINELDSDIGDLSNLSTTEKTSLVNSVNELDSDISDLSTLTTTEKTSLVDSINELDSDIGDLSNLSTTNKTSLINSINELDSDIGNLANLSTTEKTSLIGAINEILNLQLINTCEFTIGTETTDVINISIQLKDYQNNNINFIANIFGYLSDDINGISLLSTEHSGGWAIGTSGLLLPIIANKTAYFTTNITGEFNIDITDIGNKTAYLVIVLPNGKTITSSAIIHV